MVRQSSFGTCEVCDTRIAKSAMAAHLRKCLPREGAGPTGDALLIRIRAAGTSVYWLDCVARTDANLEHLDTLLRWTWLECCGHLSDFMVDRRQRVGMSVSIKRALAMAGGRLGYEYLMGMTESTVTK